MDDSTFDNETALQWIRVIEDSKSSIRDHDIYPLLNSWVKTNSLSKLLEVGCGQGVCSDKIELTGRSFTGLEPSPLMVARANELYLNPYRNFILGNAYSLPFGPNEFDGVFSVLLWHLLSDLDKANQEVSRVLMPEGRFLIITANPRAYSVWKSYYNDLKLDGKRLEGTMTFRDGSLSKDVLYLHTEEELLGSLEKASLKITSVKSFRPSQDEKNDLLIAIEGKQTRP